ncbi:MAG: hypothetical protein HZB92_03870 [Euryarchaeota archaeon]|nr:hypothetical protein [Euryarchaeota archaeon]
MKGKAARRRSAARDESGEADGTPSIQLTCDLCGRVCRDERLLKIHQRNCRGVEPPEEGKDTVQVVRAMMAAFEDDRREMLRFMADRDERLMRTMEARQSPEPAQPSGPHPGIEVGTMPPPQPPTPAHAEKPQAGNGSKGSAIPTISKDELKKLVEEEMSSHTPDNRAMEEKVSSEISNVMAWAQGRLSEQEARVNELAAKLEELVDNRRFSWMAKNVDKLDNRLDSVMDEIGYGEILDVSKIPPNILEIVYQTTLEDIVREMGKTRSAQEVGSIVEQTLEDVRRNTSGSELFEYNGRKLTTRGLAKTVEQGLISAKQVQTTYSELLTKLLERVPEYKPKNFQAMIKIKSQEYAVDMVTQFIGRMDRMERAIDNFSQMVAALSSQTASRYMQVKESADALSKTIEGKADTSSFEDMRIKIEQLSNEVSRLSAKVELSAGVAEPVVEAPMPAVEELVSEPPAPEYSESEKLVISKLSGKELSESALKKGVESFVGAVEAKAAIASLVEKGVVEIHKSGKKKRYRLVEREPEAKPGEIAPVDEMAAGETRPEHSGTEGSEPEGVSEDAQPSATIEAEVEPPKEEEGFTVTEFEARVLEALGEGATTQQIRGKLPDLKYTEVLKALRVLIDAGLVSSETKGRSTRYFTVDKGHRNEEVKEDA